MNIYDIIDKYDNLLNNSKQHSSIQLLDDRYMCIESCKSIKEFGENRIVLKLQCCDIVIVGLDLNMSNYNKTGVRIKGKIHSINFEQ